MNCEIGLRRRNNVPPAQERIAVRLVGVVGSWFALCVGVGS